MWRVEAPLLLVIGADRVEIGRAGDALAVGSPIDTGTIGAAGEAGDRAPMEALSAALDDVVARAAQALEPPAPGRPTALRVLVSERWIAQDAVAWDDGLMRASGASATVGGRLAAAGFDVGAAYVLRFEYGAYRAPFVAVAYPLTLLASLRAAAGRLALTLRSVLPLGMAAAEAARALLPAKPCALAVVDVSCASFFRVGRRGARLVHTAWAIDPASIETAWRRVRARDASARDLERLAVVDLRPGEPPSAPASSSLTYVALASHPGALAGLAVAARSARLNHPLDAVADQRTARYWSQAAAVVACAAAAWVVQSVVADVARAASLRSRIAELGMAPPAAPPQAWTPVERARVAAVNSAVQDLNLPIAALLRVLQPPADLDVKLLGVEVQPNSAGEVVPADAVRPSRLSLSAEADDGISMARYVDFLGSRPGLAGVQLVRHERQSRGGAMRYRFAVDVATRD